jgi:hypothetical protein
MPRIAPFFLQLLCVTLSIGAASAQAVERPDDYGGLDNYAVPSEGGGSPEFAFCVVYAKRAWRVGELIREKSVSFSQVKEYAREGLGRKAAAEEIEDFNRLERKQYPTASFLGAERFVRCAERLHLNPEPRHRGNAEFCFKSLVLLDLAARMRADGKREEQTHVILTKAYSSTDKAFVSSTVNMAYSGKSIAQGSTLIEDTFSSCFAEAGERQAPK